ncbi:DUF1156 domain-containing protein [Eggerthellaceae bacterium zg-887]|uniref:DUF1156 domain-containing protein n=1 Tax=Xiamenia xianingshaonis TaxID=2682776 RepID=UPI00140A1F55|nr:DUF1156 domain-containing protein [Xiamenia xianingshaonis]
MYKKKLIETSIPLDDINDASAGEKNIRKGYPATLHLWWARRPLASARCVIFASMVDDPSEHPEEFPTEEEQDTEQECRRVSGWLDCGGDPAAALRPGWRERGVDVQRICECARWD